MKFALTAVVSLGALAIAASAQASELTLCPTTTAAEWRALAGAPHIATLLVSYDADSQGYEGQSGATSNGLGYAAPLAAEGNLFGRNDPASARRMAGVAATATQAVERARAKGLDVATAEARRRQAVRAYFVAFGPRATLADGRKGVLVACPQARKATPVD